MPPINSFFFSSPCNILKVLKTWTGGKHHLPMYHSARSVHWLRPISAKYSDGGGYIYMSGPPVLRRCTRQLLTQLKILRTRPLTKAAVEMGRHDPRYRDAASGVGATVAPLGSQGMCEGNSASTHGKTLKKWTKGVGTLKAQRETSGNWNTLLRTVYK
jgi:hypothetical protein